ncbi:unnamed protein product [Ectocarpus sp. 4 AP-2014]
MRDDTRLHAIEGAADYVGDKARRVQEDIHRLKLQAGASITYRVAGPITSVRVWLFDGGESELVIEQSADGKAFQPIATTRRSAGNEANDYGYLRPGLVLASPPQATSFWVRLRLPGGTPSPVEISRVEIRSGR